MQCLHFRCQLLAERLRATTDLPKLAGSLNNTRFFGATDPINEGLASLGKVFAGVKFATLSNILALKELNKLPEWLRKRDPNGWVWQPTD